MQIYAVEIFYKSYANGAMYEVKIAADKKWVANRGELRQTGQWCEEFPTLEAALSFVHDIKKQLAEA